jgi:cation-transporting ATPase 13A2
LENKLKPETAPTLLKLKAARVRCVMVTGDNPVTAVTVAQDCQMVEPGTKIFVSRLAIGHDGKYIEWHDSDDEKSLLDPLTLRPVSPNSRPLSHQNMAGPHTI